MSVCLQTCVIEVFFQEEQFSFSVFELKSDLSKISVLSLEATSNFLCDFLWPITTGKLCKVALVVIFPFD